MRASRLLPALGATALLFCATPTRAQNEASITACHAKQSTMDIDNCLDGLTKSADTHLNAAYQKTLKSVDPSGVASLRAAERAWLDYRKQRCSYLGAGPGTIGRIVAADCFLRMTISRADELDEDAKGLGPG